MISGTTTEAGDVHKSNAIDRNWFTACWAVPRAKRAVVSFGAKAQEWNFDDPRRGVSVDDAHPTFHRG